jgi:ribosome recycling factor
MTSQVLAMIEPKMARAVEVMERDFGGVRTGRASTSLVERIHVDYYGTPTALNQLAGIAACSGRSRRRSSRATSA